MTEPDRDTRVIPVVEEQLIVATEPVKTGSVKVQKHIQRSVKRVDVPVTRDVTEVRRVPVNKVVDSVPRIRTSGDTIVVPVVEEEVVVTKRLVLKEEIHIQRRRTRERATGDVVVHRELAEVQRLDAEGRVIDTSPRTPRRRGGIPGTDPSR
jgi:uncharacterized protein (TIGR02271 family)